MEESSDLELLAGTGDEAEVHSQRASLPKALSRKGTLATVASGGLLLGVFAACAAASALLRRPSLAKADTAARIEEVLSPDDPVWGCGLVGALPGITQDGTAEPETQRLIDALKASSSFNKATYWNWNLAPQTDDGAEQHLTSDFIFMPEEWGAGPVIDKYVRTAGEANFLDSNGKVCPATMATIFLGMNEPDIKGSCMGDMFGKCAKPCSDASVAAGDCPEAHLHGTGSTPNAEGECNCWQDSHATGVGFWPVKGCSGMQPLPEMWEDPECPGAILEKWKKTAASAYAKGYKYLSTPLVAENMEYAKKFIDLACQECHDISCGCPVYVAWHFYAYDCQPEANEGYKTFRERLDATAEMMMAYPFLKGAIINEVGMLNCAGQKDNPICVPDSGTYPASSVEDHG